jgi:hypothetical protein
MAHYGDTITFIVSDNGTPALTSTTGVSSTVTAPENHSIYLPLILR